MGVRRVVMMVVVAMRVAMVMSVIVTMMMVAVIMVIMVVMVPMVVRMVVPMIMVMDMVAAATIRSMLVMGRLARGRGVHHRLQFGIRGLVLQSSIFAAKGERRRIVEGLTDRHGI